MSDSSIRTKPWIEEPSKVMSPASAFSNWLRGTSTFLMIPVMSVNWRRRNRTSHLRSNSSRSSLVAPAVRPATGRSVRSVVSCRGTPRPPESFVTCSAPIPPRDRSGVLAVSPGLRPPQRHAARRNATARRRRHGARLTSIGRQHIVAAMDEQRQVDPLRGCEPGGPRLLQLRSDRRLGHEWDDWDGNPLPNGGIFHEPPGLFFRLIGAWFLAVLLIVAAGLWLVSPRLAQLHQALPAILWTALALGAAAIAAWIALLALSLRIRRNLLPPRLVERGLLPRVMPLAERSGRWFGISRDRAGNAALRVYNG